MKIPVVEPPVVSKNQETRLRELVVAVSEIDFPDNPLVGWEVSFSTEDDDSVSPPVKNVTGVCLKFSSQRLRTIPIAAYMNGRGVEVFTTDVKKYFLETWKEMLLRHRQEAAKLQKFIAHFEGDTSSNNDILFL